VQVLFRPEDVAVKDSARRCPILCSAKQWSTRATSWVRSSGCACGFPRCRGFARSRPPRRSPEISSSLRRRARSTRRGSTRFIRETRPGSVWRRVHALTHPGLSLLIVAGATPAAEAALDLASRWLAWPGRGLRSWEAGSTRARCRRAPAGARNDGAGSHGGRSASCEVSAEAAVLRESARQHFDVILSGMPAAEAPSSRAAASRFGGEPAPRSRPSPVPAAS